MKRSPRALLRPPVTGARRWPATGSRAALALALAACAGCALHRAAREVRTVREQGFLAGGLLSPADAGDLHVVLFRRSDGGAWTIDGVCSLAEQSEVWSFLIDGGTDYAVAALRDRNRDRAWTPREPWATAGLTEPIRLAPGTHITGLALELEDQGTPPEDLLDALRSAERASCALRFARGEVTTLDDARFAPEVASDGLWTPVAAVGETGAGVYFLEPFDPRRIPVLFVHGIGGSPRDLAPIVDGLDRRRFQPWVFHYPSGFPLRAISSALERVLFELRDEHGFEQILIVAHSMGGLISRDLVQRVDADPDRRGLVGALVTLASPLAGHSAAKWGLRFAPEPVPAWIDMDPDGEFVRELARPWPADVPHVLLFGFRRGGNVLLPLSSDSVVAVAAQLPAWAQESAALIRGFDADHMEILSDPSAIALVGRVLAEAADGVPIRGRAHPEEDE